MKKIFFLLAIFLISNSYSQTEEIYWKHTTIEIPNPFYIESIEDLNKAIELDPNNAKSYHNRGVSKSHLEDHRGAIADYNKVLELDPNYAQAYFNRGVSKFQLNQKDSACLDFSKAGELGYDSYETIRKFCN